ncbi:Uncharacterized protein Adt_00984 [Abeliophyllum distichum]|uniref:Uncharacterized protein n=1 Tax=Abeliophyllum distichum TaxID=126358 RepID=A0ABD1VRW6_9LAMI
MIHAKPFLAGCGCAKFASKHPSPSSSPARRMLCRFALPVTETYTLQTHLLVVTRRPLVPFYESAASKSSFPNNTDDKYFSNEETGNVVAPPHGRFYVTRV